MFAVDVAVSVSMTRSIFFDSRLGGAMIGWVGPDSRLESRGGFQVLGRVLFDSCYCITGGRGRAAG